MFFWFETLHQDKKLRYLAATVARDRRKSPVREKKPWSRAWSGANAPKALKQARKKKKKKRSHTGGAAKSYAPRGVTNKKQLARYRKIGRVIHDSQRVLLENPSTRTLEFNSRFFGGAARHRFLQSTFTHWG